MRRLLAPLALALTFPLAACFDANITADFTNTDEVKLDAVMTMGAEIYQMAQSAGEDPCEDGVGMLNDDGTYTCSMLERRSLDALLAAMDDPDNELGIGDGVDIEERDDGLVFISFDLSEITSDLPPEEDRTQMAAMFGEAFDGHAITMRVVGKKIVETTGTLVSDTTAELVLPLTDLFSSNMPEIPDQFTVLLEPGD